MTPKTKTDLRMVGAISVLAMCIVTITHEALGHGGACLMLGGRVEWLSSAVFRCSISSPLVDGAGPAANLLAVALAWSAIGRVSTPRTRLLLALIGAFGGFWEGSYAILAMVRRNGDLYFAAEGLMRAGLAARILGAAAGMALYGLTLHGVRSVLRPYGSGTGRTAWTAATTAALVAALFCAHDRGLDLRDAVLEIGLASVPLLRTPGAASQNLEWNGAWIVAAGGAFVLFVLTLGRGFGTSWT